MVKVTETVPVYEEKVKVVEVRVPYYVDRVVEVEKTVAVPGKVKEVVKVVEKVVEKPVYHEKVVANLRSFRSLPSPSFFLLTPSTSFSRLCITRRWWR